MSGRTLGEALRAEQDAAQWALASVTLQNQIVAQATGAQRTFAIAVPRDAYIQLRHPDVPLLGMGYTFLLTDTGARGAARWRAVPLRYFFSFRNAAEQEVLAFHWHPDVPGRLDPHLHIGLGSGAAMVVRQAHIPTSPMTLRQVLKFAVRELGVEPIRSDWERRLSEL